MDFDFNISFIDLIDTHVILSFLNTLSIYYYLLFKVTFHHL